MARRELLRRLRALEVACALAVDVPMTADVKEVCEDAADRIVTSLGFERVMIFAVETDRLIVQSTRFRGDRGWASHCHAFAREHPIELDGGRLEREVLRRRSGGYAIDAMRDPRTAHAITTETRTDSYVSVPVLIDGELLGVINADLQFSSRPVTVFELDTAMQFARVLGAAWAKARFISRLREQTDGIFASVNAAKDLLGYRLADTPSEDVYRASIDVCHARPSQFVADGHPRLTDREHDVLRLMTTGARNGDIASDLHLSEGTVKSHVKHIFRKLGATTRSEAVAHYLITDPTFDNRRH